MVPSFNPQNPVNDEPVSVQPGICNTPANIEKGLAGNHGSASSSISEYLIEMLPGWRVEDFLVDSSPSSFGFCKVRNPPLPFPLLYFLLSESGRLPSISIIDGSDLSNTLTVIIIITTNLNHYIYNFGTTDITLHRLVWTAEKPFPSPSLVSLCMDIYFQSSYMLLGFVVSELYPGYD